MIVLCNCQFMRNRSVCRFPGAPHQGDLSRAYPVTYRIFSDLIRVRYGSQKSQNLYVLSVSALWTLQI